MRVMWNRALLGIVFIGLACSSNEKSADPMVVANNFTSGTTLNGATKVDGTQPEGNDNAARIEEIRIGGPTAGPEIVPAAPIMVQPGKPLNIPLKWTGGAISGFNVGFGGNSFFKIPMNSTQTSGNTTVTGMLSTNICDNLTDICHQISCYEQVTLPDGTMVSSKKVQQMVLDCSGGKGCENVGPGGTCAFANSMVNTSAWQNSACGQCYQNNCGAALANCWGSNWMSGNLTGGSCGPFFTCVCNCQSANANNQQAYAMCVQTCGQQNQAALQSCSQCYQMYGNCFENCTSACGATTGGQ